MAYTEQELITKLQILEDELDRTPTTRELKAHDDMPSLNPYIRHFGSWSNALNEAEFDLEPFQRRYTDEDLLAMLRELADDLGRTPIETDLDAREDMPSTGPYFKHFDSWVDALNEAGFDVEPTTHSYTDEELLTMLRELADDLGRAPMGHELKARDDMPCQKTYSRHFGSWEDTLDKLGLSPLRRNQQPHRTDEELLTMLRELGDDLGRTPKSRELNNHEELLTVGIYQYRFGSWANALNEAGFNAD